MSTVAQAQEDSKLSVKEPLIGSESYREYPYRFVIMGLFFGICATTQMLWVTCSPITTNIQKIYKIDQLSVNFSSLISMLLYLPITIPGNYILDEYGLKIGITVGTLFTLAGAWLRMLASESFYFVLVGQLFAGLGQPLILNCPQKISAFWTVPEKRTVFTTVLTLSAPLGGALGFFLPGAIVGSESSPTRGKELFLNLLLVEAIISTILCAPIFVFFRAKPPIPPSASAELPRESFKKGINSILKNKSFLMLLLVGGLGLGVFNSLGTVVESIVIPFGYTQFDSSMLGVTTVFSGIVGSLIMGVYVEKMRKYKMTISFCSLMTFIAFGIYIGALYTKSIVILSIVTALVGFFLTPLLPLGLEFACEITFPVGEAVSGGALVGISQLIGAAQIFLINWILSTEKRKLGSVLVVGMYFVSMLLVFIFSIFITENLIRSKHDQMHARVNPSHAEVTNHSPTDS